MFKDKIYLLLLILIPLLALFFAFTHSKRKQALNAIVSADNLRRLSNVNLNAYKIKNILFLFGAFFLILALARPQWGFVKQEFIKESAEIFIALDVSKSMLAADVAPSRLERAKHMLSRVIEANPGEKIGVIVFSGSAMWQCPMTYDTNALKMFLQSVQAGNLPVGGTQISDAIFLALKYAQNSPNISAVRTLMLISDGEDHDSKIKEAIDAAKKAGLQIVTVGIGTPAGAPVPIISDDGSLAGYVKDKSGNAVLTRLNPSLLEMLAAETGGQYFEAGDKDISSALIRAVKETQKNKDGKTQTNSMADRFQIPLLASIIFFLLSLIIPVARKI